MSDYITRDPTLDRSWQAEGACRGMDPAAFFPERDESTAHIKAICAGCPVREACLDYALIAGERFGIWGGKSECERRRMRVRRRAA